jgi:hypothetical protein
MREIDAVRLLMDALLPGGASFPAARTLGCETLLLDRLRQADPALPARLPTLAAGQLETDDPAAFATLRKQAYLTYYEQPAVVTAIKALGHPYNDSPLPGGYPAESFDPARDTPSTRRGRWIATDAVEPVDLAALRLDT